MYFSININTKNISYKKNFCRHQKKKRLNKKHTQSSFIVLFSVFILYNIVYNLKLNFKLKKDPKMRTFKTWKKFRNLEKKLKK